MGSAVGAGRTGKVGRFRQFGIERPVSGALAPSAKVYPIDYLSGFRLQAVWPENPYEFVWLMP